MTTVGDYIKLDKAKVSTRQCPLNIQNTKQQQKNHIGLQLVTFYSGKKKKKKWLVVVDIFTTGGQCPEPIFKLLTN